MAVGLKPPAGILPIPGVRLGSAAAGIRYQGRDDLVLIALPDTAATAAVFTRNRVRAAPVQVASEHLAATLPRALLINAGNANAATGQRGVDAALTSCRQTADRLRVDVSEVLPFSTGTIGDPLPVEKFPAGIEAAAGALDECGWERAAAAIMTTDTLPKAATRQADIGGRSVTATGMVKGSGMICPDMATLLAFAAVDAAIPQPLLNALLGEAVGASFNRITVDGDTSTNDACVLIANGNPNAEPLTDQSDPRYAAFAELLTGLMTDLAQAAVRDAEGATKFVEVTVTGGASERDCRAVAYTVAHSPLVKTALFASDPNWGRILAAVGRAPVGDLTPERLNLRINGVGIVERGQAAVDYSEARGQAALAPQDLLIEIDLGLATKHRFTVWTTDLSQEYVSINADYRS